MADWNGNEYAVMNLRTIQQNIAAYTSYAENGGYSPIYDKMEAAVKAVGRLIKAIENDNKA